MTSKRATGADQSVEAKTPTAQTYRVHGMSRPGGHGKIRCNTTDIKADTGSISDGFRPGPAELLCAALAACLLKNVERYSEILPFQYEQASVVVEAERRDAPPAITRLHYTLELVTDEPPNRIELLHRNVRKFGTITNTLAAALDLTGEVIARPHHEQTAPHIQGGLTDTIPGDSVSPLFVRNRHVDSGVRDPQTRGEELVDVLLLGGDEIEGHAHRSSFASPVGSLAQIPVESGP